MGKSGAGESEEGWGRGRLGEGGNIIIYFACSGFYSSIYVCVNDGSLIEWRVRVESESKNVEIIDSSERINWNK